MNVVQYFKQGAEFWVSKINTEGKFEEIREEARIWLMQQNGVRKC